MPRKTTASEPETDSLDDMQAEYVRLRPEYVRFTKKLESLLGDLLNAKNLGHHLIESRTKELNSFREKVSRSSKTYKNPIIDLTDLSGLRIITYYQDDADAIGRLVESEFNVDVRNSVDHSNELAEFGYRSSHYVVRLSAARAELLEWAGLAQLKAEIQVRTVLQHAWAAISHKLQYKREEDVPAQLRRKLFRLSALFELADDEFVSLRDASGTLSRAISTQLSSGHRQIPIDYVSLSQFIDGSPVVSDICAFAAEAGFNFDSVDGPDESDSDSISDLIKLAAFCRLPTIAEFEATIDASLKWASDYLRTQYVDGGHTKGMWHVTPAFICELILICAEVTHLRPGYLLQLGWDRAIASRVFRVAQDFNKKLEP